MLHKATQITAIWFNILRVYLLTHISNAHLYTQAGASTVCSRFTSRRIPLPGKKQFGCWTLCEPNQKESIKCGAVKCLSLNDLICLWVCRCTLRCDNFSQTTRKPLFWRYTDSFEGRYHTLRLGDLNGIAVM